MTVQTELLERLYRDFVRFIGTKNETFKNFKSSAFIDREENYKYAVYEQAKESLGQQWWKQTDIGTGKIQGKVKDAIKTKLVYQYQWHNNNLVDWRKRDDFAKLSINKSLETTLFNFFKNKTRDSEVFEEFLSFRLSYQLIAYLYFIKDPNRYLPITQERFDEIFELIGIPEFKTSGNASWDNYTEYVGIIKQVREFLKSKDANTSLLDAHSFLYILGSQMKAERFPLTSQVGITLDEPLNSGTNSLQDDKGQHQDSEDRCEAEIVLYDEHLAEEFSESTSEQLFEGAKRTITINAYERNPKARQLCIEYWKPFCVVCEFNFEDRYGELGKGFIHVHHLIPVSQIGDSYEIDPIKDLRPVCPNCHAMLHRQERTLTIEELKSIAATNMAQLTSS
jgi:hypothetical protein